MGQVFWRTDRGSLGQACPRRSHKKLNIDNDVDANAKPDYMSLCMAVANRALVLKFGVGWTRRRFWFGLEEPTEIESHHKGGRCCYDCDPLGSLNFLANCG